MISYSKELKSKGKSIGFCPTMGALHRGHISLIKKAQKQCDKTIASIFVNPTQFNSQDDLVKYPREELADLELLKSEGCHAVFIPDVQEIYPHGNSETLKFDFGSLDKVYEGEFRSGHFSGVGLVVTKLFNIVRPDKAYFGRKDLQQLAVIKKLVEDLNLFVEVVEVETEREKSGLAMSSRNKRLNEDDLKKASQLYVALKAASIAIRSGENVEKSINDSKTQYLSDQIIELEYFDLINADTFEKLETYTKEISASLCLAASINGVRLIDNMTV